LVAGLSIWDFGFVISDWEKRIYDILWQKFFSQRRKARKDKLKIKTERSDIIIRRWTFDVRRSFFQNNPDSPEIGIGLSNHYFTCCLAFSG
jgi:hypothetical protein